MTHEEMLLNLLAVLHKDGGHYTSAVGLEKAYQDALTVASYYTYRIEQERAMSQKATQNYHSLIGELLTVHDKLPDRIKVLADNAMCSEGL
jgi:hypothetical protein